MTTLETYTEASPSVYEDTRQRRDINELLTTMVAVGGSDLHVTTGIAPCYRIDGVLARVPGREPLSNADTEIMVRSILTSEQWQTFTRDGELDLAYSLPGVGRFRMNVFRQRGAVGTAMRAIPFAIRGLDELGMPAAVESFAGLPRGLVLVTGPTGSGKSTTLASLLDVANRTRTGHIMTVEDPIEYLHTHKRCVVNQREVGGDTESFPTALRHALRQDPDIILVGELRDLETTSVALTAAETGHLVLATLHTQSAAQTIDRVIDIYPPHQQGQIRAQLANCLQGVVTQSLIPRKEGRGRVAVCEVMIASPAIRNLVREGKAHQIPSVLQSSRELGMIGFDQHLAELYHSQLVSRGTALDVCQDITEFKRLARI
ncbi:PilT/PilU family type 4a pilus ATPase [Dermatophilaceae bacterium Soc4.6]